MFYCENSVIMFHTLLIYEYCVLLHLMFFFHFSLNSNGN